MKLLTQGRTVLTALSLIVALALMLPSSIHAQNNSPPAFGNFYSAKNPDMPPLPFNPHPELTATEVEPGHYVVDDTSIPDTPQEAAARATRQAATQRAKAIAINPIAAQAAQAAQQSTQEAMFASIGEQVSPWLHEPMKLPDGTPSDFQTIMAQSATDFAAATSTNDWRQAALATALSWAATNDLPTEIPLAGDMDAKAHLISIDEGPLYVMPCNVDAAQTIATDKVWPGGSAGLSLNGTNRTIFMWDEGQPRLTHSEYSNRVFALPSNTNLNKHATAVVGTLVAGGVNDITSNMVNIGKAAKGMSFTGVAQAGSDVQDFGQMPGQAATNNMRVSNHSYEHSTGWYQASDGWYWFGYSEVSTNADPKFGVYSVYPAFIDQLAQNAPNYLGVWAAGNDVSNAPPVQPTNHFEFNLQGTKYTTNIVHPRNGDAGGYDTVSDLGCAKNILTIGAILPLYGGYTAPSNVVWAPFSSCGPTDDGRIKPDVVGDGVNVITCNYSNDASYDAFSGTSFSCPSVAGSVNLLGQYYKQLRPNAPDLLSSTLKGLVIQTTDQATTNAGPDYRLGWGLMNTARAAGVLANDATNGLRNFVKEVLLANATYIQFPVVAADGTNALRVTICWTDPYGPYHALTNLDNPAAMLVNDLDLRVIAPNGTTNFPWLLNPDLTNQAASARSAPATTGDDTRNNVEQVYLAHPTNGTYLVQVTHKSSLQNSNAQWVSILISGNVAQQPPPLVINQIVPVSTNQIAIGWPAVVGQRYQVQYVNSLSASNNWQNFDGQISARLTNVVAVIPFSQTNTSQFYRLAQVP